MNYTEFAIISGTVQDILIPLMIFTGVCGSLMAILLVSSDPMLQSLPSNRYLFLLSVSSAVFLILLMATWLERVFQIPLLNSSGTLCKTVTYLSSVSDFVAVWCIVAISAERFVILFFPKLKTKMATIFAASAISLGILAVSLIYNLWIIFLSNLVVTNPVQAADGEEKMRICSVEPDDFQKYSILSIIDIFASCLIPSLLVFAMNVAVAVRFAKYEQRHTSMVNTSELECLQNPSTTEGTPRKLSGTAKQQTRVQPTALLAPPEKIDNSSLASSPKLTRPRRGELTRCMLIVTTSFTLLNLPSYLCRGALNFWEPPKDSVPYYSFELIFYILYYLHHTTTFYLYAFHTPSMRRQLSPMFWRLLVCQCCSISDDDELTTIIN